VSAAAQRARGETLVPAPTVVRGIAALRETVADWRRKGADVGIVPTMGALHEGHLELVRRARAENRRVITTIFVNPIQFNRSDDLAVYPRDEARDLALLGALDVDLVFAPPVEEVYPAGFQTKVAVPGLIDCLCGVTRPGHMDGVATVVAKLLLQALPDRAYFGEKDYQQLLVVRRMARDLDIPAEIVGVPTVREADGLALSSRNALLDRDQRRRAPALYRVLGGLATCLAGDRAPAAQALAQGRAEILAAGFDTIDYLDLRDGATLEALPATRPGARLFAAAWLGSVRLIDNLAVE